MYEAVTVRLLEQKLIQFRQEFREEMIQELLRIFISSMAGQQVVVSAPVAEPEAEAAEMPEDDMADISGMPDIMEKIMSWSED